MTTDNEQDNPNRVKEETEQHKLAAKEILRVTTWFEPNRENPEVPHQTGEKIKGAFEPSECQWEYDCSCGKSFKTFSDGVEHLEMVGETQ